jgi:hypothetical protein
MRKSEKLCAADKDEHTMKTGKALITLSLTALFLLVNTLAAFAQQTSPSIWLASEISQASAGQEFTVSVNVSGGVGVYGSSFKLAYDPQALEVVVINNNAVTPGTFFGSAPNFPLKNTVDAQAGTVEYALTLTQPAQPVDGDGLLGTVTFRALTGGEVVINPVEARLLSPEFAEVDGRLIAQSINEVEAQTQGVTVAITGESGISAPAIVSAPVSGSATASASASVAPVTAPRPVETAPAVVVSSPNDGNTMIIIAGVLFLVGLGLFATSVGTYVGLRRQPSYR